MRFILALFVMLASFAAHAAFIEADVGPTVTSCGVLLDTAPKTTVPVTNPVPPATQKKCRYDVSTIAAGVHDVRLTAIVTDPVWGALESAPSAPFAFARPGVPPVPANPQLVP